MLYKFKKSAFRTPYLTLKSATTSLVSLQLRLMYVVRADVCLDTRRSKFRNITQPLLLQQGLQLLQQLQELQQ